MGSAKILTITGLVIVAIGVTIGLNWSWLQQRACDGPTIDEVYLLSRPEVEAYNRLEKESAHIRAEDKKRIIDILKRNSEGWTIPWTSPPENLKVIEFSIGSKKILSIRLGEDSISRGMCEKKLSATDMFHLKLISNQ